MHIGVPTPLCKMTPPHRGIQLLHKKGLFSHGYMELLLLLMCTLCTCLISLHVIVSNMVPCSNKHIDWVEVLLINKPHGDFTSSSSQQTRIGCFPVPHTASISWSGIHICPIRSDQFLIARERKRFRSEGHNGI